MTKLSTEMYSKILIRVILKSISEKCSTFGSDLCFKIKIKEIIVKIGGFGTNDDVSLSVCSDYDVKDVMILYLIQ